MEKTPGDWTPDPEGIEVRGLEGKIVCYMSNQAAERDVHLICSAPRMAAAIKAALVWVEMGGVIAKGSREHELLLVAFAQSGGLEDE